MTRLGRWVLVAAIALYLAGAANASEPAYTFASALIGVLLATYVLSRLAASGLSIRHVRLPRRVVAGRPATAVIEIANAALISKPRARLAFSLRPSTLEAEAVTVQARVPPLRRGARATVEVDFTVPWRGAWLLENFHLEGSDPLGLYVRRQNLQQAGGFIASPAYWTDLPVPWERLLAPGTRLRMAAERVEPTEYRAVRDYVPGDDIRHIHWPASAHRSKLQVKIYDRRREVQVQIWLAPVAEGRAANEGAEVAISVAATLARIFALAPLATVVRAPGLPLSAQGPGSGEGFWLQVLAMLAELPYCGLDAIEAAASDWAHGTRAGGTIYLVSNSASALRVLTSAVPRYCYPIRIATSRSAAVRGARVISSFSSIPMRLAALSRALQKAGTVAYGGR